MRRGIMIACGLAGLAHETLLVADERFFLLVIFAWMAGVPIFELLPLTKK